MASEKYQGDFGARLREARERRGLSLRVIADTTKISVRALEALERNEIARLPGGIFSRGFVRAYALEVGLDPEQAIAEFMTRFPDETVTQGHPRTRAIVDELENDSRRTPWPAWLRVALVAIPAVAILGYLGFGRRAAPSPVQPAAAATTLAVPAQSAASARFAVTMHARLATTFSVSSDGGPAIDVSLEAGTARSFEASSELLITPVEPSALEWSANGVVAQALTGPITITPGTLLRLTGRP